MGKRSKEEEKSAGEKESKKRSNFKSSRTVLSSTSIVSERRDSQNVDNIDRDEEMVRSPTATSSAHYSRRKSDSEKNFRKQSKIRDLLNSVKEDIVQMQDTQEFQNKEIIADPSSLALQSMETFGFDNTFYNREGHEQQRTFTRISPTKVSSPGSNNNNNANFSKWKRAKQLSRTVVRPLQSLSKSSRDYRGKTNNESDNDDETSANTDRKKQVKMLGLLKLLDHGSSIAGGILAGLLLWSTISSISWAYGFTRVTYTENFIQFYYTVAVVLTYITVIGFQVRLYSSWDRLSFMIVLQVTALLLLVIFHYISKGYDLLRHECITYNNLKHKVLTNCTDPVQKKEIENSFRSNNHHCPSSTIPMLANNQTSFFSTTDLYSSVQINQLEFIFLLSTQSIQTISAIFIACYFHFKPYVQLWVALGPKIKSKHVV